MAALAREAGVLMLAYRFPPASASGALRPYRFARYLPGFGYRAHVVCSPAESGVAPPFVQWTAAGESPVRGFDSLPWRIAHRLVSPYNDRLPWTPAALSTAADILRQHRIDLLFSTYPPLAVHIAALSLKRRTGLPWVADFRDPLLDNPFRPGWRASVHDRIVERLIVRSADLLIANTEPLARALSARYPEYRGKIQVIPNGYDPEAAPKPRPIPPRDRRVMAHAGAIYGGRHPVRLLESLDRLIAASRIDPARVRVELTGNIEPTDVPMAGPLFDRLGRLGCLSIDARRAPREEALKRITEADYLLLLDLNSAGASLQVPAKLFDYILAGRPILAFTNPGSPASGILERSGVPHSCIFPAEADERADRVVEEFLALPSTPVQCSVEFLRTFSALAHTEQLARSVDVLLRRAPEPVARPVSS